MKYTNKLGLPIWNKPETDVFDIEQFNEGMQAVDDIVVHILNQINDLVIGDKEIDLNGYIKEEVFKELKKKVENKTDKEEVEQISSQLDTKASLSYVDSKIGNMGNTKTFKGSCVFSALPTEANIDDYWYVTDKSTNYCWNGTTWVDIGSNLNIGDGTLTTSKFAFAPVVGVKSKNLFNKNNVTSGYYVNYTTGKLLAATGYSASEFIMVEPNTEYCKNTTHQFAFYDVNKTYISGLNTDKVFTTPSNCVYIRLSVKDDVLNTLQLEKGNIQTDYVDYDFNTIDMRTINDGGITKEKLSFIPCELTRSKNLFNKEDITKGYYINYTTGKPTPNADYCISDYIEVLPNTTYSKATTYQFAFYDKNKVFISGLNTDTTFITPSNCKYIR